MRFERLLLTRFGPFTGEVLDLSGGAPGGLHVIFGPNGAGKSTSLRAVRGLLFGIDVRSPDAHLHPLPQLEIGAELSHQGQRLLLRRLKKRKDTLVDAAGQPVDEAVLGALLGHLDERTFTTRLGLDQAELEKGAEALLGGSEQGLFAAGTAGADVRRLVERLERDCAELFLPKGKLPKLNQALARLADAQRFALEQVRSADKYLAQKREAEAADARLGDLRAERRQVRDLLGQKRRLLSLLSDVSALRETEASLVQLEGVPFLAPDSAQKRIDAERALRDADIELAQGKSALDEVSATLEALGERAPWADIDEASLDLRHRIGWESKARIDLPKRKGELDAALGRLREGARALELDVPSADAELAERVSERLPTAALSRRTQQLIARAGSLKASADNARLKLSELDEELAATEPGSHDAAERELAELLACLDEARALMPSLSKWLEAREQLAKLAVRVERQLVSSGRTSKPSAVAWDVELQQAVESEAEWARLVAARRSLADRQRQMQAERAATALEERRLARGEDLPSVAALQEARTARDALLRAAYARELEGPALERELEPRLRLSDELADRLRVESTRLAEIEVVRSTAERLELLEGELRSEDERLAAEVSKIAEEQLARLGRLGVSERVEPRQWAARVRALVVLEQLEGEYAGWREQMAVLRDRLAPLREAVARLRGGGVPSEEALLGAVDGLERRRAELSRELENVELTRARRRKLEASRAPLVERLEQAERELSSWQAAWREVLALLGQRADSSPESIGEVLVGLAELSRVENEVRQLSGRIAAIERDSRAFGAELSRIVARHAPDLLGHDLLDMAEELALRLETSRQSELERERLVNEGARLRERVGDATNKQKRAQLELAALVSAASASSLSELPEIERNSELRRDLLNQRARCRASLLEKSAGESIEQLLESARGVEHRTLSAEVADLDERAERLEVELREAEMDAAGKRLGLERFGSESAAEARQVRLHRLAEARELMRGYLVRKAALTLLQREMASYAERFAGPLSARASQLFERLTLGAFRGLRVSPFDQSIAVISGKSGHDVEIEHLSRGERAQLYFSLRVASLERYFGERSAVPLLLDDLFVDFDDDRTSAAFEILGELAEKVQILYFTHLGRDVILAEDAARGRVFQHRIGAG